MFLPNQANVICYFRILEFACKWVKGMRCKPNRTACHAFTLVELLVVIGIIALLIGILLPTLSRVQQQSRKTACLSNLRQLGTALILYANENRGRLPNGNAPTVWDDYDGANRMITEFNATCVKSAKVFYCPADQDSPPEKILTADQKLPNSGRVSYDFYSLYWAPEYGPLLVKLLGQAPLVWDLNGGNISGSVENHKKGGNVVYADGHAGWQEDRQWEKPNWPSPATKFFP
jgi:prepilin-type N-terminal cleavage/methylation domain-containing protein/prepilin-type processing-associated H-X9-DG protein